MTTRASEISLGQKYLTTREVPVFARSFYRQINKEKNVKKNLVKKGHLYFSQNAAISAKLHTMDIFCPVSAKSVGLW